MTDIEKKEGVDDKVDLKEDLHKLKIYLSSCDLKSLEKVCSAIVEGARGLHVKATGPHRLPRKRFTITTRKSPCGNGTNTFERWELRVYKRRVDIICPANIVKSVTKIAMDPKVQIDVTVSEL